MGGLGGVISACGALVEKPMGKLNLRSGSIRKLFGALAALAVGAECRTLKAEFDFEHGLVVRDQWTRPSSMDYHGSRRDLGGVEILTMICSLTAASEEATARLVSRLGKRARPKICFGPIN